MLSRLDPDESFFISRVEQFNPPISLDNIFVLNSEYKCQFPENAFKKQKQKKPMKKKTNVNALTGKFTMATDYEYNPAQNYSSSEDETSEDEAAEASEAVEEIKAINFTYLGKNLVKTVNDIKNINILISLLGSIENIFMGLQKLHSTKIYHCDIKPLNLVLDTRDDKCKIIDFGGAIFKNIIKENAPRMTFTPSLCSLEYIYRKNDLPDIQMFEVPYLAFFEEGTLRYDQINQKVHYYLKEYTFNENTNEFKKTKKEHGEPLSFEYYALELKKEENSAVINPWFYEKNDIWSMGLVLQYIVKHIVYLFDEAVRSKKYTSTTIDAYRTLIDEIQIVIGTLLDLNVEQRPNAEAALIIYNDFLGRIRSLVFEGSGGRKSSRKTRKIRKRKSIRKTRKGKSIRKNKTAKRKTIKIK
jgi:serine/threonine protein kinase